MSSAPRYVLGSDDAEVARLDGQAAALAPPTELLLRAAGIGGDMRVLDLGTGLGHVAFAVAELLGAGGEVVGVDQDARLLGVAEERRRAAGLERVRFERADARDLRAQGAFDAVVTRLLLFHLPDALEVLRAQLAHLRPGGVLLALDADNGASRADPPVALVATVLDWIERGFRSAGADPRIGAHLGPMLREAGFEDVIALGIQGYSAPGDPGGPAMLAGVARALAPQLAAAGIADGEALGLDTLEARLARAVEDAGAVLVLPTLVGAWGRRAAAR